MRIAHSWMLQTNYAHHSGDQDMSVDDMIKELELQDKYSDACLSNPRLIIAALKAGQALAHAVYSGESDRITEAMADYMKEVK
jgi:hypothetical protein